MRFQVIKVSSADAMAMARRLAKEEGVLCGISSGAAVQVEKSLSQPPQPQLQSHPRSHLQHHMFSSASFWPDARRRSALLYRFAKFVCPCMYRYQITTRAPNRVAAAALFRHNLTPSARWQAAINVGSRPEMKGKRIVVVIPSFGERYLSTALFSELTDASMVQKADEIPEGVTNAWIEGLRVKANENMGKKH